MNKRLYVEKRTIADGSREYRPNYTLEKYLALSSGTRNYLMQTIGR
jgi:hypothetical protein